MNDDVIRTAPPCFYPDHDWDEGAVYEAHRMPEMVGRPRCDHDSRLEAERHYYDDQIARIRVEELDLDLLTTRNRCDFDGCARWEDYRAVWPDGYRIDSFCGEHAYKSVELHPFTPGMQVIHS